MTQPSTAPATARLASASLSIINGGNDSAKWDRYVESAAGSTFCHQIAWKGIITDILRHDALYLAAIDDAGEWAGVLPLVRVRSVLGHHLISLPFLNDGGPLGAAPAKEALAAHALKEAKRSGADLLELRSRDEVPGPLAASHRRVAVHLALPASAEELWKKTFRAKLRSQIRRAEKEGMVLRLGSSVLDDFYQVFARNMRDLGTPVLSREFFRAVSESFGARAMFAVIYTGAGKPAAGACCFHWREEMEVMWASSLRSLNHLSPNMLLYSGLMEEAIRRGVRVFNFGRSIPGGPTHRFKLQWGGADVPLPWPSWSATNHSGVPSTERRLLGVASAAWKHVPLAIANRLGPPLARRLP